MTPIKGLSERRRLPRIGKIHLGIMVKNEKGVEHPKAVDYFVFPRNHPQYQELVKLYGEQPKELPIMFPLEEEDKFVSQYYRAYSRTRGLVCKGDGEKCYRMIDKHTGDMAGKDTKEIEMRELPCDGRECVDYQAKRCSELMNLQFFLPQASGLGIWQIDTGSIHSIMNINSGLDMLRLVYKRVSFVPVLLFLEKKEVTNPDDGRKKNVWVLNIKSPDNMIRAAMNARVEPLRLVAGITEDLQPDEVLDTPVPDEEVPEVTVGNYDAKVVPGVMVTPPPAAASSQAAPGVIVTPPPVTSPPQDAPAPGPVAAAGTTGTTPPVTKDKAKPKSAPKAIVGPPQEPKTPADIVARDVPDPTALFNLCFTFWQLQPGDVCKQLGYKSTSDLQSAVKDYYRAFAEIRELNKPRPEE
ncbi:MAG: hypothetical protein PHQ43_11030 [Dehalococcoidales bacterium]|nr:hypothetical protein [Dehalococcoidales bacterium]